MRISIIHWIYFKLKLKMFRIKTTVIVTFYFLKVSIQDIQKLNPQIKTIDSRNNYMTLSRNPPYSILSLNGIKSF